MVLGNGCFVVYLLIACDVMVLPLIINSLYEVLECCWYRVVIMLFNIVVLS